MTPWSSLPWWSLSWQSLWWRPHTRDHQGRDHCTTVVPTLWTTTVETTAPPWSPVTTSSMVVSSLVGLTMVVSAMVVSMLRQAPPGKLWVAGQRCLGGVMLLGSPHSSVLSMEVFCNTVIHGFTPALCWRQQLQGTFVPQDTPWEAFAPVLANHHQLSQQPPGRCREHLGRGMGGLGAGGTARAGESSPSIEPSDGEGCKGAGGVPAALTLSKGFPRVVDVKPPAPCKASHSRGPPLPLALGLHFRGPTLRFAPRDPRESMMRDPKNTTRRTPWPFFCASSPRGALPRPAASPRCAVTRWARGDGAELCRASLMSLSGGCPAGEDISPCTNPAHPIPGITGALLLPAVGLAGSGGKESACCPVELAEFPKVGQVNFFNACRFACYHGYCSIIHQ